VQKDDNSHDTLTTDNLTTKFDYNSWYIGVGSSGSLSDRLLYGVEGVYEGGRSLSNSFTLEGTPVPLQIEQVHDTIQAWAADARLDYLLADPHHTRLSAELIVASGDPDRTNSSTTFAGNRPNTNDHAFNAFGLLNTGLAFAPAVSNIMALRLGGSTFPIDLNASTKRMQFGTDLFVFAKTNRQGGIDEPSDPTGRYLGWEPDIYMNWQITSDVTFAARYGVFFPDPSTLATDQSRQFLYLNVTYSF
jgi:alginate export protein